MIVLFSNKRLRIKSISYLAIYNTLTRKRNLPDNFKELEQIHNCPNKKPQLHQYDGHVQNILSPYCEEDAKRILSCLGDIVKIPRDNNKKTFDFEVIDKNIMFEVTGIPLSSSANLSNDQRNTIQNSIEHIGEKESDKNVIRGGVIWYSPTRASITALSDRIQDCDFITEEMKKYHLSFILFVSESVKDGNSGKIMSCPSLFYVTKQHKIAFDCLCSGIKRIII